MAVITISKSVCLRFIKFSTKEDLLEQSQYNSNYSHSLHPKTQPSNTRLLSHMVSRDFAIGCLPPIVTTRFGAISMYVIGGAVG